MYNQNNEKQNKEEAVAEDVAAFEGTNYTTFQIPIQLVSAARDIVQNARFPKKSKKQINLTAIFLRFFL